MEAMERSIFFIVFLACSSTCCVVDWDCKTCVENDCIYVVTKSYKKLCASSHDTISKVKSLFDTPSGCKMVDKLIERNEDSVAKSQNGKKWNEDSVLGPFNPILYSNESWPTNSSHIFEVSTARPMYVYVVNSSTTTVPKSQETTTASVVEEIAVPSSTESSRSATASTMLSSVSNLNTRDRTLSLADSTELFLRLPTFYDCPNGERNESLLVAYASSLCTIAKLSDQYGIDNFSDSDKGWFYLNPARRYNGMCTGIRRYRKVCRSPRERKVRKMNIGLQHGQRSALFQSVDSLWHCGENESEGLLNRLARIICYSGELFLELKDEIQLHTFDLAFGLRTPAFRHAFKCSSLFYKKRRCYKLH